MIFQYETEGFTPMPSKSLSAWLNERGVQGWQLVSFERIEATPPYDAIHYRVVWMRERHADILDDGK